MIRSFIVGCRCARCCAHGRHNVGYPFVLRAAQRKLRRKSRELLRRGRFEDVAKISFGWPG